MKRIASIIAILALVGTVLPSILYLAGTAALSTVKTIMILSTVAWFLAAPFWMEHKVGE